MSDHSLDDAHDAHNDDTFGDDVMEEFNFEESITLAMQHAHIEPLLPVQQQSRDEDEDDNEIEHETSIHQQEKQSERIIGEPAMTQQEKIKVQQANTKIRKSESANTSNARPMSAAQKSHSTESAKSRTVSPSKVRATSPLHNQVASDSDEEELLVLPQRLHPAIEQDRRRRMQRYRQVEAEKGKLDNFMTRSDKNFLAKIHNSQMAALADEFYSSSLDRQQRRKQNGGSDEDDTGRDSEPENGTIRNNLMYTKGALGQIALSNLRNPKQLIQVKHMATSAPQVGGILPRSTRLLLIEDIQRNYLKTMSAFETGAGPEVIQYCQINLWKELRVDFKDLQHPKTAPPALPVQLLSFSKFRKLFPLILQQFPPDHRLLVLRLLFTQLSSLPGEIVSIGRTRGEELLEFLSTTIAGIVPILEQSSLEWVNGTVRSMCERGDLVYVLCSKAGCVALTLLVSRGEMLHKQRADTQWQRTIEHLFSLLTGHFNSFFPSLHSAYGAAIESPHPYMYVWHFFAALATSSPKGAISIAGEVKEKVLTAISDRARDPEGIVGLNVFLGVMGLDDKAVAGN